MQHTNRLFYAVKVHFIEMSWIQYRKKRRPASLTMRVWSCTELSRPPYSEKEHFASCRLHLFTQFPGLGTVRERSWPPAQPLGRVHWGSNPFLSSTYQVWDECAIYDHKQYESILPPHPLYRPKFLCKKISAWLIMRQFGHQKGSSEYNTDQHYQET